MGTVAVWRGWREGSANCTEQSTVQIPDILSVYWSAVHPCVSAAVLSAENFLSALRDVTGEGVKKKKNRENVHFSSSLWGSSIFHNLFCLVTSSSPTLEMHRGCYITREVFFFWPTQTCIFQVCSHLWAACVPAPQQHTKGRDTKSARKMFLFPRPCVCTMTFFMLFYTSHTDVWEVASSLFRRLALGLTLWRQYVLQGLINICKGKKRALQRSKRVSRQLCPVVLHFWRHFEEVRSRLCQCRLNRCS